MMVEALFPMEFTRILMPIDCTPESLRAVELASRLSAKMVGATLNFLAAVPPTPEILDARTAEHLREGRVRHAEGTLKAAANLVRNVGQFQRGKWREAANLAEATLAEAATGNYDLLVIPASFARPDEENPCAPTLLDRIARGTTLPVILVPNL